MQRHNHRRSRVAGALAAAILYGAALAFASSLNGTSSAQATMPRENVAAAAQVADPALAAAPVEDPLATIGIASLGLGGVVLWQLRRLARRRPRTAPIRLQPVPKRVTTLG